MAMAKEILGASLLEKYNVNHWSKPVPRLGYLIQQHQSMLSSYPTFFSSSKRELLQRNNVKRKAVATLNIEDQSTGVIVEKPITYKVNALVNVRYDKTEDVKETMLQVFDAFNNSTQKALILQLLSTEIDPSKQFTFLLLLTKIN
jgi:hypothetical protein